MSSNILLEALPRTCTLANGLTYHFNAHYKTGIQFELLMQDNELTEDSKLYLALRLFFGEQYIPLECQKEAILFILWFYKGGGEPYEEKAEISRVEGGKREKPIYSFEADSLYFYSAFLEQYQINLRQANLHWWEFRALFLSLSSKVKLSEIMQIRATSLEGLDKAEKKRIKRLKSLYALKDMRNQEEKEKDFYNAFS